MGLPTYEGDDRFGKHWRCALKLNGINVKSDRLPENINRSTYSVSGTGYLLHWNGAVIKCLCAECTPSGDELPPDIHPYSVVITPCVRKNERSVCRAVHLILAGMGAYTRGSPECFTIFSSYKTRQDLIGALRNLLNLRQLQIRQLIQKADNCVTEYNIYHANRPARWKRTIYIGETIDLSSETRCSFVAIRRRPRLERLQVLVGNRITKDFSDLCRCCDFLHFVGEKKVSN